MSTVGVEVSTVEDTSSEVMKVSEAKGIAFESFGDVVDALSEAVGELTLDKRCAGVWALREAPWRAIRQAMMEGIV